LTKLSKKDADRELGGLTGLCKANAGIVLDECARCAILLFGGNGYTRTGQGEIAESTRSLLHETHVENISNTMTTTTEIYREVPGIRIPGGSEDVLLDLAVRQLVKLYQDQSKAEARL
jgi:acyl-CoA dehydrogenase